MGQIVLFYIFFDADFFYLYALSVPSIFNNIWRFSFFLDFQASEKILSIKAKPHTSEETLVQDDNSSEKINEDKYSSEVRACINVF